MSQAPTTTVLPSHHPIEPLQHTLATYLSDPDRPWETLLNLLEGRGLPPVGDQEEPYLWILRGLPEQESARDEACLRLTETVAIILHRRPDETPLGRIPERLNYNLLLLSENLYRPRQFAEPLFAMWKRRKLTGRWQGLDLRVTLMNALTTNQLDERLWSEWEAMLRGEPTHFLPGRPEDGFNGALWMPTGLDQLEKPNLRRLGEAFDYIATRLKSRDMDDQRRCGEFERLIQRVETLYPDCRLIKINMDDRYKSSRTTLAERLQELCQIEIVTRGLTTHDLLYDFIVYFGLALRQMLGTGFRRQVTTPISRPH